MEVYLRKIQLSSDSQINQADEVISDITEINRLNRPKCAEAISSLHAIVDERKKIVLEQMSVIQTMQEKAIEEYIKQVQDKLKILKRQKEELLTIVVTKDQSKLQQSIKEFYQENVTQLKQLQLPIIVKHQIEVVNELLELQQKLNQFGRFIPYENDTAKVEKIINISEEEYINLGWSGLTDQDMKIVAKTLRDNRVKHFFLHI